MHYHPQGLISELIEGLTELRGPIWAGLPRSTESDRQKLSSDEEKTEMQGVAALGCEHSSLPREDQNVPPQICHGGSGLF